MNGAVQLLALHGVAHPPLHALPDRVLAHGREQVANGTIGIVIVRLGEESLDRFLKLIGRHELLDLVGHGRRHPVEHLLELLHQPLGEFVAQRPPLALQQRGHEVPHGLVERSLHARSAELLGEIVGREEPLAHGAADRLGQAGLVLGDRPLEPERPQPSRLVRVEQHGDRDGIRDAAGQCPK